MEQQWRGGGGGGRGSAEEVKGRMRLKMRGLVKGMMEENEFTDGAEAATAGSYCSQAGTLGCSAYTNQSLQKRL